MYDEDTDRLLEYSPADLAGKLAADDPDEESFVLRVVSARLAARAGTCGDPLHVVKDLSRAAGSLAEATQAILDRETKTDPDATADFADAAEAVEFLDCAAANLWALHQRF
ncbi:hypothetical protein CFN78_28085 [Amycolatopsis antarctica]|uniref:Uncharacterized protein n=2 Tax=Amycolatopsis antarctica TaxID=1854586 RepID=A0A263CX16_9PSEU|nr:hypothetical protein CFN78_28085 [Amycolatopsis antarctica]